MATKKSNLNNLFSGKQTEQESGLQDGEGDADAEDDAYMSRLTRQERKQQRRKLGRGKDKISTKDARVLTGGQTVADHAELSRLQAQLKVNDRSKAIKKNSAKGTSHEITKAKVLGKLKKARVAVSTQRINK